MDFKSLNYVLAVTRTGSISQAAEELGISQPSLSRYIQNLNQSIGVQLFIRKANRLALTYAGERYAAKAARMLELSRDLYNVYEEKEQEVFGTAVRISTPFREGYYINPFAVMQFRKSYPDTSIIFESNDGSPPDSLLEPDGLDVAIIPHAPETEGLVFEPLIEDEICLVTSAGHACAQRAIWHEDCRHMWLDMNSLRYEDFIVFPPESPLGRRVRDFFEENGMAPGIALETYNIDFAINAAITGAGICLAPNYPVHFASYIAGAPSCYSVGAPLKLDINFAYPADRPPDLRTRHLMELIRSFIYI